jgi:hypothetical protein
MLPNVILAARLAALAGATGGLWTVLRSWTVLGVGMALGF